MPLLILCYAPKDVYKMDKVGLFYHAQPNKSPVQQSVVQPLDQGIVASFKVQYKKKAFARGSFSI